MILRAKPSTRALLAALVICNLGAQARAEKGTEDLSFPYETIKISGGGVAAPALETVPVSGKDISGEAIQLTLSHSDRSTVLTVTTEGEVDGNEFNTLSFKVRFPNKERRISINVQDVKGGWAATHSPKHSKDLGDGWYQVEWDIVFQPDIVTGLNTSALKRIHLSFPNAEVPAGEQEIVLVNDLKLVSGKQAETGDPKLFKKWREFARFYKADYSDSSAALLPPKEGRIATPIKLASAQKALCEIALPNDASAPERLAAEELQHWIEQITGAKLPIVEQPAEDGKTRIYLGSKFAKPHFASDLEKLGTSDGYAVRTKGNSIYIFGSIPKGTLNGSFAFLENNTDIIWPRPFPDYGVVYSKNPELSAVWGDAIDIPGGVFRGWMPNYGGDIPGLFNTWSVRNRNNYTTGDATRSLNYGDRVEFGGGHNLQAHVPKDDPAFFPIVKGEKPDKLSIWKHQICMSAPNLEEVYAQSVLKYLQEKAPEGMDAYNIKIEDNWGVCECEKCTAPITLPNGEKLASTDPAFRSTQFYIFLNSVTEKIAKVYPDLQIQTYAYFYTATPPKVALHKNIYILFCPYVRKDHRTPLYSPINDHWWKMQKGWAEATPNVVVREYYGIFNEGRPLSEVVAEDIRVKMEQGVRSFSAEVMGDYQLIFWDGVVRGAGDDYDVDMMEYWLINRIYWNPNADVEGLRKYFIRRTFREAAPQMEKVFGIIREGWYHNDRDLSTWGNGDLYKVLVGQKRGDEVLALLDEAFQAAKHPTSRILIGRIQERIKRDYLKPKKASYPEAKAKDGAKFMDAEILYRYGWFPPMYRTSIERGGKIVDAWRVTYENGEKPVLSASMRPMHCDMNGITLRFTLIPGENQTSAANLPFLKLTDDKNIFEKSPETAYKRNDDGSFTFSWKPSGEGENGRLNLGRIHKAFLDVSAESLAEGEKANFMVTDFEIVRGE